MKNSQPWWNKERPKMPEIAFPEMAQGRDNLRLVGQKDKMSSHPSWEGRGFTEQL